jgi:hypothetical protein
MHGNTYLSAPFCQDHSVEIEASLKHVCMQTYIDAYENTHVEDYVSDTVSKHVGLQEAMLRLAQVVLIQEGSSRWNGGHAEPVPLPSCAILRSRA